jgi:hypothetical protein
MVMEHAEALERIEIAAAEPDGIDRLMAGDTADAAAVAGHLAGCPACVAELARIRRTAHLASEVIRSRPDPDLRARTLAFVAATGVERGVAAPGASLPGPAPVAAPAAPDLTGPATAAPRAPASIGPASPARRGTRLGWVAAIAAAVLVALGAGYLVGAPARERLELTERQVALLEETTAATLRVQAQPDATRVELRPTGPGAPTGTLLFSPSSGELVMVARDLAATGPREEYGCWVEAGGTRERIGRMYWAGELWTWAGRVEGLDRLPADASFGVSLGVPGAGAESVPILEGGL